MQSPAASAASMPVELARPNTDCERREKAQHARISYAKKLTAEVHTAQKVFGDECREGYIIGDVIVDRYMRYKPRPRQQGEHGGQTNHKRCVRHAHTYQ